MRRRLGSKLHLNPHQDGKIVSPSPSAAASMAAGAPASAWAASAAFAASTTFANVCATTVHGMAMHHRRRHFKAPGVCRACARTEREDEGCIAVNLDRFGLCAHANKARRIPSRRAFVARTEPDLAPRDRLVRARAAVAAVELLAGVDEDRVVRAVPTGAPTAAQPAADGRFVGEARAYLMRLALQVWCLHKPPPRMIMPLFFAASAMSLIARMSRAMSTISDGLFL